MGLLDFDRAVLFSLHVCFLCGCMLSPHMHSSQLNGLQSFLVQRT